MMLRLQAWAYVLALLFLGSSTEANTISAQEHLNRTKAAIENLDLTAISQSVQALCKEYPDNPATLQALLLQADFARNVSGDTKLAKTCFEKITQSDTHSMESPSTR